MHELSIAESLIEIVRREMATRQLSRVDAIHLRIGELTDVVPDALSFGYEVLTKDTELEPTRLVIDRIPVAASCNNCAQEFPVTGYQFICPACAGTDIKLVRGMELDISSLEISEDEVA